MHLMRYYLKIIIAICILVAIDLITKTIFVSKNFTVIENVFSIIGVFNYGASWGILKGQTLLLVFISSAFIVALFIYNHFETLKTKLYHIGFVLIVSGGIANIVDRVYFGYVRDFIKLDFITFPVFNFADIIIVTGSVLISFFILFQREKQEEIEGNSDE